MAYNQASFRWHPNTPKKELLAYARRGVIAGSEYARAEIVKRLSTSQRVKSVGDGSRRVGLDPSRPWGDPKMLEGDYRRSINTRRIVQDNRKIQGFIHSNDKKAARLEFGFIGTVTATSKNGKTFTYKVNQAPRPTIRRTIHQKRKEIANLIMSGGRRK